MAWCKAAWASAHEKLAVTRHAIITPANRSACHLIAEEAEITGLPRSCSRVASLRDAQERLNGSRTVSVGMTLRDPSWVCAVTRRRFPVGASPTRQPLQPEATGAVMEATKWLKPSDSGSRIGDRASVQAATRVNAEQTSKRTMRRPTRRPFRGRLTRLGEVSEAVRPAAAPG